MLERALGVRTRRRKRCEQRTIVRPRRHGRKRPGRGAHGGHGYRDSDMAGARQQVRGAADVVFAHCLAVIGDEAAAEDVARTAFLRAGPWRATLLGHARHEAVRRAEDLELLAGPPAGPIGTDADVTTVARVLARSRPPLERAIIDLRARTGTDRTALGRALGVTAQAAADRAAGTGETWDSTLDPALLAFLGPGGCDGLAAIVGSDTSRDAPREPDGDTSDGPPTETIPPPSTYAELLALVPAVAAHTAGCDACGDRRRAMVSVRTLFGGDSSAETPASVRAESRRSRVRRPAGLAPPIERGADGRRPVRILAGAAALLLLIGAASAAVINATDDEPHADAVGGRSQSWPAGGPTRSTPRPSGPAPPAIPIRNESAHPVRWRAAPAGPGWRSRRRKARCRRAARPRALLRSPVIPLKAAPTSLLTVTADDGTAVAAELRWTVERAPEVEAALEGCTVKAIVADSGELSEVTLHVRNGADQAIPMTPRDDQWEGDTAVVVDAGGLVGGGGRRARQRGQDRGSGRRYHTVLLTRRGTPVRTMWTSPQ